MIDTVKAMVLEGVGRLAAHDHPRPDIGKGALLMGMELCGVCGTDIHRARKGIKMAITP